MPWTATRDGAGRVGGPPGALPLDPDYAKSLQLEYTAEDPNVFTTPWSARVTYRLSPLRWQEQICAENIVEYWWNEQRRDRVNHIFGPNWRKAFSIHPKIRGRGGGGLGLPSAGAILNITKSMRLSR